MGASAKAKAVPEIVQLAPGYERSREDLEEISPLVAASLENLASVRGKNREMDDRIMTLLKEQCL